MGAISRMLHCARTSPTTCLPCTRKWPMASPSSPFMLKKSTTRRRVLSLLLAVVALTALVSSNIGYVHHQRQLLLPPGGDLLVEPTYRRLSGRNGTVSMTTSVGGGGGDDAKIPRIIHQTWENDQIPSVAKPWLKSWLQHHPDWEYWFWTDEAIEKLMEQKYSQYLRTFRSYPTKAMRVDIFKYIVLYEYGGVYVDIDVECLRPITDFVVAHDCFVSQEPVEQAHFYHIYGAPVASNALMGCRRAHPFFAQVLDNLPNHEYGRWFKRHDIHMATGSHMLTSEYWTFTKRHNVKDTQFLYLAEPDAFQPVIDSAILDRLKALCEEYSTIPYVKGIIRPTPKKLCQNLLRPDFNNSASQTSYADHHWARLYDPGNDKLGIRNSYLTFTVQDLDSDIAAATRETIAP